jgi:GTP cyclohydrolase II
LLTAREIDEIILKNKRHRCREGMDDICVKIVAIAQLPSKFGRFQIVAFHNNKDSKDHVALVHGNIRNKDNVPVRLHSECLTGDAFGSLRCDCRDQLIMSMKMVGKLRCGVILYLRQEGRGIGLMNKLKAYQLQDHGLDTIEANIALGFKSDERDYGIAAHMIHSLEIKSIRLITNNPAKEEQLKRYGIVVKSRIPILAKPNKYNTKYLRTKMEKAGHMLDDLFVK